ncbi:hypothetical protein ACIPWF_21520 [Paenarthrobacter sp. NPDC089989]|uniref:hypothetical protein n=1 Tax=unclassified Paenarthrobacter TaxID=2634190 RepID=UPI00381C61E1
MTEAQNVPSLPWPTILAGRIAELVSHGETLFRGVVDIVTEDGETVWLIDLLGERRMFHSGDGYTVNLLGMAAE